MGNRKRRSVLAATVTVVVVGAVALGVRGCGTSPSARAAHARGDVTAAGDSPGPAGGATGSSTSPSTSTAPGSSQAVPSGPLTTAGNQVTGLSPLTGLPAPAANLHRPALVVKIDNVTAALPQTGVDDADVVYEELVEGGLTRLAAVFQSTDANPLGPVRSGRTTDIGFVADLGDPVLAYAGANAVFEPLLRAAGDVDVDAIISPGSYYRMGPHVIPHNLYTSTQALYAAAHGAGGTPPQLFTFRAPGTPLAAAGATPAATVAMSFPAASVGWQWSAASGTWLRTQNGAPDVTTDGAQLQATNVIIQSVPYQTVLYATGEGLPAPEPIPGGTLVGFGPAWVMSGGSVVAATWSRPSLGAVTTYTDSAGQPIALAPGRTWIELLPTPSTPQITP